MAEENGVKRAKYSAFSQACAIVTVMATLERNRGHKQCADVLDEVERLIRARMEPLFTELTHD